MPLAKYCKRWRNSLSRSLFSSPHKNSGCWRANTWNEYIKHSTYEKLNLASSSSSFPLFVVADAAVDSDGRGKYSYCKIFQNSLIKSEKNKETKNVNLFTSRMLYNMSMLIGASCAGWFKLEWKWEQSSANAFKVSNLIVSSLILATIVSTLSK